MSYAQNDLIQATDFNSLVGGNPTTTANTLNATWAVGGGSSGYGQTPVANVAVGDSVAASNWNSLITNTANAATHQGSSITNVTAPSVGGTVTYLAAVPTNLQTVYSNRLNAATQSATSATATARGTTWSSSLTFTHVVTFASGDAARYFFNAGGQIKMTTTHANTTGSINLLFNQLCTATGTVVLSSPSSGSITVVGTSYNGITKVGGSGTPTISANKGYYALTSANSSVFTQAAGASGYSLSNINYTIKTNGTQGVNGDAGSVVTIYTTWTELGGSLVVGSGSTTTLTLVPPEATNIANTWGTISVAGSVTGS